jgi:hypothetical protein
MRNKRPPKSSSYGDLMRLALLLPKPFTNSLPYEEKDRMGSGNERPYERKDGFSLNSFSENLSRLT